MNEDGTIPKDRVPKNVDGYINSSGGFAGGSGSQAGAGGASIGVKASSGTGGSAGHTATTQNGGAMGNSATSTSGFAGGARSTAGTGGAVGVDSKSERGGAAGQGAIAGDGFCGGYEAQTTVNDDGVTHIDAIQLGTGTNSNEKTLQVYDYQLMRANGRIPIERMGVTVSESQTIVFSSDYQTEIDYVFGSGTYKADVVISNSNESDNSRQVPVNTVCILGANKIIFTKPQGVTTQTSIDITYKVIEYKN